MIIFGIILLILVLWVGYGFWWFFFKLNFFASGPDTLLEKIAIIPVICILSAFEFFQKLRNK